MNLTEIMNIINEVEHEVTYDVEANHHFEVKYSYNELHLCLVESYHDSVSPNTTELQSWECSVEDYCNLVISVSRDRENFCKFGMSEFEYIKLLNCNFI